MQILHWLYKLISSRPTTTKENTEDGEAKHQDIFSQKKGGRKNHTGSSKGKRFGSGCPVTLNLRRDDSFDTRNREHRRAVSRHMKEEKMGCNKVESAVHVGNKVLPVSENVLSSSRGQPGALEKKDQRVKVDKTRPLSRMEELLRRAAAAKSAKGAKFICGKVLRFRSRAAPKKTVPDDDQLSSDSPKISFNWEVESCSTISSAYSSSISLDSSCGNERKANWITTDSEFVVLEL